jgi:hypothetical protein
MKSDGVMIERRRRGAGTSTSAGQVPRATFQGQTCHQRLSSPPPTCLLILHTNSNPQYPIHLHHARRSTNQPLPLEHQDRAGVPPSIRGSISSSIPEYHGSTTCLSSQCSFQSFRLLSYLLTTLRAKMGIPRNTSTPASASPKSYSTPASLRNRLKILIMLRIPSILK